MKKYIFLALSILFAYIFTSCESEEDFGFPSKIIISGNGETIDIKGSSKSASSIIQLELLDYNGDGNNSGHLTENKDYLETTTDWLTVKLFPTENKLVLSAGPNPTGKNRKLYLYLLSGRSRREITITQPQAKP